MEQGSDDEIVIGITQIITASILVHTDGHCRIVQHDPDLDMWLITDRLTNPGRVAFSVTQNEVRVHLPKSFPQRFVDDMCQAFPDLADTRETEGT